MIRKIKVVGVMRGKGKQGWRRRQEWFSGKLKGLKRKLVLGTFA